MWCTNPAKHFAATRELLISFLLNVWVSLTLQHLARRNQQWKYFQMFKQSLKGIETQEKSWGDLSASVRYETRFTYSERAAHRLTATSQWALFIDLKSSVLAIQKNRTVHSMCRSHWRLHCCSNRSGGKTSHKQKPVKQFYSFLENFYTHMWSIEIQIVGCLRGKILHLQLSFVSDAESHLMSNNVARVQ